MAHRILIKKYTQSGRENMAKCPKAVLSVVESVINMGFLHEMRRMLQTLGQVARFTQVPVSIK